MKAPKFCPLSLASPGAALQPCLRERCGWWVEELGECAVNAAGWALAKGEMEDSDGPDGRGVEALDAARDERVVQGGRPRLPLSPRPGLFPRGGKA